ncbi:MAG: 3-isopropylmalate dehydratase large subunit [Pseudohongiellaceae bacterium]
MSGKTLYDKIWDSHLVNQREDGTALIYIDRHLIHEVTSPQAFEGLRMSGRAPWRSDANLAVPDHNIPTTTDERRQGLSGIKDPVSKIQVKALEDNCKENNILSLEMNDIRQGIVHVMGPEQGATLPGMTIVCGDSHTSTHGALGALAHGIGTSEVEHVLATQCLMQRKMKNMLVRVDGVLKKGVTAKDVVLAIIGEIGTAGGTGYTIEFGGEVIKNLSIEGRMTVCNMAIEAGARAGLIAVDQKTLDYVKGRPFAPSGDMWARASEAWRSLVSDSNANFDRTVIIDGSKIEPQVTWGTSPEMVAPVSGSIPDPTLETDPTKKGNLEQALKYMGLKAGTEIKNIQLDYIFIGSCTNSRIEDLREAAQVVKDRKVAENIEVAMVVPGSGLVKKQAEEEGLDQIFTSAGIQWREPGCSMCLAMNSDQLGEGKHCASTSNRNFEGRQGFGGRTHLVSPAMAAAAAIHGHFVDVSKI